MAANNKTHISITVHNMNNMNDAIAIQRIVEEIKDSGFMGEVTVDVRPKSATSPAPKPSQMPFISGL